MTSFAGILKGPPARLMHSSGSHAPSGPEPQLSSPQPITPSSTVTVMPCRAAERSSAATPALSLAPLMDFTGELVAVAKTSSESSSSTSSSSSPTASTTSDSLFSSSEPPL